jgi:hypothetical protein
VVILLVQSRSQMLAGRGSEVLNGRERAPGTMEGETPASISSKRRASSHSCGGKDPRCRNRKISSRVPNFLPNGAVVLWVKLHRSLQA